MFAETGDRRSRCWDRNKVSDLWSTADGPQIGRLANEEDSESAPVRLSEACIAKESRV